MEISTKMQCEWNESKNTRTSEKKLQVKKTGQWNTVRCIVNEINKDMH